MARHKLGSLRSSHLAMAIVGVLAGGTAQAATIVVDTTADGAVGSVTGCSLREAVASINAGAVQGGCTATGAFGSNDTINFTLPGTAPWTITLQSGVGVGPLAIDNPMRIDGPGAPADLVISGGDATGIALVEANLTLADLSVRDANGGGLDEGGALYLPYSSNVDVTLENCVFADNESPNDGGAIAAASAGSAISISNCTFDGNIAGNDGGALYAFGADLTITDSTFTGNESGARGGAIAFLGATYYGNGVASISDSVFIGNSAELLNNAAPARNERQARRDARGGSSVVGGAIFAIPVEGSSPALLGGPSFGLSISTSSFSDNQADAGGALAVFPYFPYQPQGALPRGSTLVPGDTLIIGSSFDENFAREFSFGGGAVLGYGSNVDIESTTFSENVAVAGGAVSLLLGELDVRSSTVSGNLALALGAGVLHVTYSGYNVPSSLSIRDTTVSGNQVGGAPTGLAGRGIVSSAAGAGVFVYATDTRVTNSTFSGNLLQGLPVTSGAPLRLLPRRTGAVMRPLGSQDAGGGALAYFAPQAPVGPNAPAGGPIAGRLAIDNSTFNLNSAPGEFPLGSGRGGLWADGAATITLRSSIFANATGTNGSNADIALTDTQTAGTPIVTATNSLVEDVGSSGITATGGNVIGNDPQLAALASNGGPTQTHAITQTSPAFNTGANPQGLANDQRGSGFPRVVGAAADIGAFEFGQVPASIVVAGGGTQSTPINTAFAVPLQVTVLDAGSAPVAGITVTFAAPGSGASAGLSATTCTTNAAGQCPTGIIATANGALGSYAVTASVTGVATPATFNLTNTVGAPASINIVTGDPQTTPINTAFPVPLQIVVRDGANNPVSGRTVNFAAPGSGASAGLSANSCVTDAAGQCPTGIIATANGSIGSYVVTATTTGVAAAANFNLTNTTGAAATLTIAGGSNQSTLINTAFGTALLVSVRDSGNNPVQGAVVTFVPPGSGAGANLSSTTCTTNAAGQCQVTATANGVPGSYVVSASVPGVATPVQFNLTNLQAALPVPVMAPWAAGLLALLMGLFGWVGLRRQRES
jgi:CSLREA domain-containing protein